MHRPWIVKGKGLVQNQCWVQKTAKKYTSSLKRDTGQTDMPARPKMRLVHIRCHGKSKQLSHDQISRAVHNTTAVTSGDNPALLTTGVTAE